MSVAWYLSPYDLEPDDAGRLRIRTPAMHRYAPQYPDPQGTVWAESEVLGNACVFKVRASDAVLNWIDADPDFLRLPVVRLADSLSSLKVPQKNAIKNRLAGLGYSGAEIDAAFPNDLGTYTLGDVLRFAATRRLKPRWDALSQSVKVDGSIRACRPIADIDRVVSDQPPGRVQLATLAWTTFLSGLYFGTGFRPPRGAIQALAQEAVRLGLTVEEHSYEFLAWVAQHSSMLLFRLFGAFPTTGLLDAFGVTENPISDGGKWTTAVISGDPAIQATGGLAAGTGALASGWRNNASYGPDSESFVDFTTKSGGSGFYVFVRLQNPGSVGATDGYGALARILGGTDGLRAVQLDNDAETTLGTDDSHEWADGDKIGLEAIGTTGTPYYNAGSWVAGAGRDFSTYNLAGNIGLRVSGTAHRADNYSGGTVVAAAATKVHPALMAGPAAWCP